MGLNRHPQPSIRTGLAGWYRDEAKYYWPVLAAESAVATPAAERSLNRLKSRNLVHPAARRRFICRVELQIWSVVAGDPGDQVSYPRRPVLGARPTVVVSPVRKPVVCAGTHFRRLLCVSEASWISG